jgi:hypothetical protein
LPHQLAHQRRRADAGNDFVHFSIAGIEAAQRAKRNGHNVACLLEHPEDLGRCHRGEPASIWQPEVGVRKAFGNSRAVSVAGHQCQFPDTDRKKPTRLWSDIDDIKDFGFVGWPCFDAAGYYIGPLPHDCGHRHKQPMIGRGKSGGFNTAPTAAYPPGMCEFIAKRMFNHWYNRAVVTKLKKSPYGGGSPPAGARDFRRMRSLSLRKPR